MLRYLRALAWLRWRTFMNTLTRTGSRDAGERASRLLDQLLPIVLIVVVAPSAIVAGVLGGLVGWSLERDVWPVGAFVFTGARAVLVALTVAAVIAPITVAVSRRESSLARFLILPVPRRILHRADVLAGIVDPWTIIGAMFVLGVPIGLAVSGRPTAAAIALAAGGAFVLILLAIGACAASLVQLVFRSRRRGETITVAVMMLFSLVGMVPAMLAPNRPRRGEPRTRPRTRIERPAWTYAAPSELQALAVQRAARGEYASTAVPVAGVAAMAGATYMLSWVVYRRLIETPETSGTRRRARASDVRLWRIPGLSPGASAAAWLTVRLVTRTMRGRMALLSPPFMIITVSMMFSFRGDATELPPALVRNGSLALSAFGAFIGLLSLGPITVNQFGADGAGLTRQFLAPLTDREILLAKAAGGFVCAAISACLAAGAGLIAGAAVQTALHLAIIPAMVSNYWLSAPANAALSILLPKSVDLGVLGRAGQPNQLAGLGGLVGTVVAAAPSIAVVLICVFVLHSTEAALLTMMLVACASAGIGILALRPLAPLLARRRDNLGLVAEGK